MTNLVPRLSGAPTIHTMYYVCFNVSVLCVFQVPHILIISVCFFSKNWLNEVYPSLLFCWARLKEVLKQFIFIGIWAILLHISKIFLYLKKKIICLKCQQSPRKQNFTCFRSLSFTWFQVKGQESFPFPFST